MLYAKSLPKRLWDDALNCTTYIQNKYPHISIKDITPFKAWNNLKSEVTHFLIFGSHVWVGIPFEKRKELDPHSTKCIFVGYLDGLKVCRLIYLSMDQLIFEHSFQFEDSILHEPQQPHIKAFVLPPIKDDEHAHSKSSLDESYNS
jgi:hypothetical protein